MNLTYHLPVVQTLLAFLPCKSTRIPLSILFSVVFVCPAFGQTVDGMKYIISRDVVAFRNVTVVPMDKERVIKNQTVIIRVGIISEIVPATDANIPGDALEIDGTDQYLMPGLADMHVHFNDRHYGLLFVANGITVVRNMWGYPKLLEWRQEIRDGTILGPDIYTTGPPLQGKFLKWPNSVTVRSKDQAERIVKQQKDVGYDFIKVHNMLTTDVYDGVVAAAKKFGMPVVGHIPLKVAPQHVLASGQYSIEHLLGWYSFPTEDAYAKALRNAGAWSCPTTVAGQGVVPIEHSDKIRIRLPMKYASPRLLKAWGVSPETVYTFNSPVPRDLRLVNALYAAGARIVLGTDAGYRKLLPGFSVVQELLNYVEAGLTPYQALRTATRNAAEMLNRSREFGTIAVGRRADLILLDSNPLEDVLNVTDRAGVMVRGKWLPKFNIDNMLKHLASLHVEARF